jgi:serine/threonine-protein kinase
MPNVVGQLKDDAEKFLKDQGFTAISFEDGTSDDPNVQVNEVIKQDPGANQDVKKDAVIKLTISTGRPKVAVPDVAGKSVAEAASILGQQGLDGSKTTSEGSATVPKDQVIRTDPSAGTQVDKGSKVTIIVSSGVAVPSVTGLTKAAAENAITNAGLSPQGTCHVNPTAPAAGEVTSQSPAKDTRVDGGSVVKFDFDAPVCS